MEIISERSTVDGIKNYLNDNITDQLWAKDVVSEAASIHYQNLEKNNCSAMIMIGNSGIGRTKLLKLLSVFFRVPFLKCDVKTLFGYTSNPACYIFPELLKLTSNNIEKASLGIVYLENVNTSDKITQKELLKLIKGTFLSIQSLWPDCLKELKGKYIHTKNIWFIGGIDCDIEGKLARRFIQDTIGLTVNRRNVIGSEDLHSFGMLKELVEMFTFVAPFHCNDQQILKRPMCNI